MIYFFFVFIVCIFFLATTVCHYYRGGRHQWCNAQGTNHPQILTRNNAMDIKKRPEMEAEACDWVSHNY